MEFVGAWEDADLFILSIFISANSAVKTASGVLFVSCFVDTGVSGQNSNLIVCETMFSRAYSVANLDKGFITRSGIGRSLTVTVIRRSVNGAVSVATVSMERIGFMGAGESGASAP